MESSRISFIKPKLQERSPCNGAELQGEGKALGWDQRPWRGMDRRSTYVHPCLGEAPLSAGKSTETDGRAGEA